MSSFYILSKDKSQVDVSTKAETSYVNNEISKVKTLISTEDAKHLDLDGNRSMKGDIDMSDNTLIGVGLISASNSAVPRNYIDNHFVSKTSKSTMQANLNMANYALENVPAPTHDKHAANKKYVVDLIAAEIAKLQLDRSTYALGFIAFPQNTWRIGAFPTNSSPTGLMDCSGLNENSYFVLKTHTICIQKVH